jgi:hypothetical protein
MADDRTPQEALRLLILEAYSTAEAAQDRNKFSKLLDCINNACVELPQGRPDGRSDHPTRRACLHATLIDAISLLRQEDKDLPAAVRLVDRMAHCNPLDYTLEGDQGAGWTMRFVPRLAPTGLSHKTTQE